MAAPACSSAQRKALGLAAVVFALLVSAQGQQPNNAGGNPPNPGQLLGGGPNPPFQGPPGSQPKPGQPQQPVPGGPGFRRRGPFARAGLEGPAGAEGQPGGPGGRAFPPDFLARRMAFLQAAAARARAMQEAAVTADAGGVPDPTLYAGRARSGLDGGRPLDVPTGVPQFPHPQGIPTRQGGNGNAANNGVPQRARAKREHVPHDVVHRRSARTMHVMQSGEE